jgi:signal transduction histidine kinase/PAS domain-containing protein
LIRSLSRILRRHRVALADRLSGMLSPALEPCVARGEADAFLERLARALKDGRVRRIRRILAFAASRWTELGADPATVSRAMLALALPLSWESDPRRDPWTALRALFAPVLDTVPQPLLVLDLERCVRLANRRASELFGVETAALAGQSLESLLDDDSHGWIQRQLIATDAARDGFGRVRVRSLAEGERLASAVRFETGEKPAGWLLVLHPAPDRMLSDPSLGEAFQREKRQKEQFGALLTVSHAVINSLELKTILATIAKQVRQVIQTDECTVFLYDEREDVLKPEVCEVEQWHEEMMSVRLKLGEGITGTVALTGKGEIVNEAQLDPRAVQVPGTPEEDDSSLLCVPLFARDKVVGAITLVRTNRTHFKEEDLELATLFAGQCSAAIANARLYESVKAAYEELRQTQAQLVQSAALNALGEMAGGVAHDFNNILAAILGRTQLLLQGTDVPEVRRQLQVIEQAAHDGAHTVRRVQEFTRVRHDERFETLDVNQVLLGVIELTRPAWEAGAKRRGVTVVVARRLEASRPIAGNASELREVFTNLMLNAVDAMPRGGELRIESEDDGDQVRVRFSDSGVGMDESIRARIFDPFFTTKTVKGTGLGLSVAYGIVTRHRGTIQVASEPGRGATFSLTFPASEPEEIVTPAALPGPLTRLRVLVVDDEEPVLNVLADLLRALGQDVHAVLGGPAGLARCEEQEFDVVFSDLGMPEVNGWDLALAVKSRWPSTTVVLVTGWGYQLEGGAAQAHGVDVVMPKPFSLDDCERVLRRIGDPGGTRAAA